MYIYICNIRKSRKETASHGKTTTPETIQNEVLRKIQNHSVLKTIHGPKAQGCLRTIVK